MKCTEEVFLKDIADHQLTVIKNDGIYRHLRFKKPDSGDMYFDIVTWPGYLAYSGDMGCYVFSRVDDMFQFFRNKELKINPGYWSEKVQAGDRWSGSGGIEEFSLDWFVNWAEDYVETWIDEEGEGLNETSKEYLSQCVDSEVVSCACDGDYAAREAVEGFYLHFSSDDDEDSGQYAKEDITFHFVDSFDADFTDFTYRYLWCCFALVWGINQYDEWRVNEQAEVT